MPQLTIDGAAVDRVCTWPGIVAAMEAGHRAARHGAGSRAFHGGDVREARTNQIFLSR